MIIELLPLQTISGPLYLLSQGAMTGKEQGHATQAHVAPPEAHGGFVAGRRVDLGVCVQIIHTCCERVSRSRAVILRYLLLKTCASSLIVSGHFT